jgi:hypothetical protein
VEEFESILTERGIDSGRVCVLKCLWCQNEMKYSGADSPVRLFKPENIADTESVLISGSGYDLTPTQSRDCVGVKSHGCTRPWLVEGYDPIGVSGWSQQIVALGIGYWV